MAVGTQYGLSYDRDLAVPTGRLIGGPEHGILVLPVLVLPLQLSGPFLYWDEAKLVIGMNPDGNAAQLAIKNTQSVYKKRNLVEKESQK